MAESTDQLRFPVSWISFWRFIFFRSLDRLASESLTPVSSMRSSPDTLRTPPYGGGWGVPNSSYLVLPLQRK